MWFHFFSLEKRCYSSSIKKNSERILWWLTVNDSLTRNVAFIDCYPVNSVRCLLDLRNVNDGSYIIFISFIKWDNWISWHELFVYSIYRRGKLVKQSKFIQLFKYFRRIYIRFFVRSYSLFIYTLISFWIQLEMNTNHIKVRLPVFEIAIHQF